MKKTKNLMALVLALVLAFSLMAMPAAAAQDHDHDCAVCSAEEIQPRISTMICPACGGTATLQTLANGTQFFKCRCGWSDKDIIQCPVCGGTAYLRGSQYYECSCGWSSRG